MAYLTKNQLNSTVMFYNFSVTQAVGFGTFMWSSFEL